MRFDLGLGREGLTYDAGDFVTNKVRWLILIIA